MIERVVFALGFLLVATLSASSESAEHRDQGGDFTFGVPPEAASSTNVDPHGNVGQLSQLTSIQFGDQKFTEYALYLACQAYEVELTKKETDPLKLKSDCIAFFKQLDALSSPNTVIFFEKLHEKLELKPQESEAIAQHIFPLCEQFNVRQPIKPNCINLLLTLKGYQYEMRHTIVKQFGLNEQLTNFGGTELKMVQEQQQPQINSNPNQQLQEPGQQQDPLDRATGNISPELGGQQQKEPQPGNISPEPIEKGNQSPQGSDQGGAKSATQGEDDLESFENE